VATGCRLDPTRVFACELGLARSLPATSRYRRAAREFSCLVLVEDTPLRQPSSNGAVITRLCKTQHLSSLADCTEVCGTRRQILDLGAYFVRHGRNPIILRVG
jgi:hypothetical protein